MVEPVLQQPAVRQSREIVVQDLMLQLVLEPPPLALRSGAQQDESHEGNEDRHKGADVRDAPRPDCSLFEQGIRAGDALL